ncbi:uncharacterized protein [Prorops nasuta]|uniref:uncharacterized protein n=1 Tax=Prorops nasuta TaxID=863751 RepID=UPI0034CD63A4
MKIYILLSREFITLLQEIKKQNDEICGQNEVILSKISRLQMNADIPTDTTLYNKPGGLPLKTIDDFNNFEEDILRLQDLERYLSFIGGIKLREALSHFMKETMTDELASNFTYWGRNPNTIAFFNTKTARIFYRAAKSCKNFIGPENRAIFKFEISEAIRATKQRFYIRQKGLAEIQKMQRLHQAEMESLSDSFEFLQEELDLSN